ncbi:MAG: glycosyltransferase family 4 protein [Ignavibacteria bacterium]|nr:glycosyltransferase family 4 protein [Ignavibacteria bacterium]
MKKVLIISYYFPPSGGPGVQRVLKFVKYLPQFGWQPVVLTVEDGEFPARDESLLKEIPESVHVYRTKIFEPYNVYKKISGMDSKTSVDVENIPKEGEKVGMKAKFTNFVRSNFFIPDARIGWKRYAVKAGLDIIKKENISILYSSSPPYTCSLIARDLKRKTGLKWIAGFRDPWTGFLNTPKRKGIARNIDLKYESSVYNEADMIDTAWVGIKDDILSKTPHIGAEKIVPIPNGFDEEDFEGMKAGVKKSEKFTITYTGSMYGVRNPEVLLKALDELNAEKKISPNDLIINFVGRFSGEIKEMFERSVFKDSINHVSYVTHNESIAYLLNSDALLLVIDDTKDVSRIIPGKVYEYLGAHKPIICIGQKGSDVENILTETGAGKVCAHSDMNCIKSLIMEYFSAYKSGTAVKGFDPSKIDQYSRRNQAGRLAELFNKLSGAGN